jgi:NCAIR mutase (PurE)-related protein
MLELLRQVQQSEIAPEHALRLIAEQSKPLAEEPASILQSFARLDHGRSKRTGFPEAVFAEGKTAGQVAAILDDMARNANEAIRVQREDDLASTAIIATR